MTISTTPTLHLGAATQTGPLTVFPIWTDAPLPKVALRAAMPRGATVSEADGGSSVSKLTVRNPSDRPFLLPGATVFDGGWQHRVLVHSVVVSAGAAMTLDVRCVEQGRWGGGNSQRLHRRRAPLAVRGALRGIDRERGPVERPALQADQGEVWARVRGYEASAGISSTMSLVEMTDQALPLPTDDPSAMRPLLGQRGVLIGIGGHPVLLEVFDHPRTLQDQWEAMLTSVVVDARRMPQRVTSGARARTFVQHVAGRRLAGRERAGDAAAVEARDDLAVIDGTVLADGRLVHLAALNGRHDLVAA